MSARTTLVLLAVLLGCSAAAYFVQGPGSAERPRAHAALVPGLPAEKVALVRVAAAGAETLLTRAGAAWRLGAAGEPADAAAVEALLALLAAAREGEVVSTNPAKQAVYEIDGPHGIAVRLEDAGGKVVAAFTVGATGPGFAGCYLRRDGSSEVLLVSPDLRPDLARPPDAWRMPPQPAGFPAPEADAEPAR